MRFIKLRYKLFFTVLIIWFLFNLNFKIEIVLIGLVVAFAVTIATFDVLYDETGFRYRGLKVHKLILYIGLLFIEIFRAAFSYIANLISKKLEPIVFKVELDFDDPVQVGIVANSITLTPGTISVEVEGNVIYVFTLAKPGTDPKELEKPIHDKFETFFKEKRSK